MPVFTNSTAVSQAIAGTNYEFSAARIDDLGASEYTLGVVVLDVSVDTPGKWPNPEALRILAGELGFRPSFEDGRVWQDEENEAINWVQVRDRS